MAYGCNKLNIELEDPQKQCEKCKSFAKKYWQYPNFIQGPDSGPYPNCVHVSAKWRPKKFKK